MKKQTRAASTISSKGGRSPKHNITSGLHFTCALSLLAIAGIPESRTGIVQTISFNLFDIAYPPPFQER
ncbi:MAG: hypothetical protein J7647_32315 [Cyanobacteria bacterium SBLK]|nr:hypothetical protein [Cyanobacteria bacterium SBLK]